ncbi:MAG: SEC-C domain-containing protein [Acidimicrobiales bacterium]
MEQSSDVAAPGEVTDPSPSAPEASLLGPIPWGSWARTVCLRWDSLEGPTAECLPQLTVRVLSRDPLERAPDRSGAFAVAESKPGSAATRLYVIADDLLEWSAADPDGERGVLGRLAGSVAMTASRHQDQITAGRFSLRERQGKVPPLLSMQREAASLGLPEAGVVEGGYEFTTEILEDAVEAHYGPARLDRSDVVFDAADVPTPRCPACEPGRIGFPEELEAVHGGMCGPHMQQAASVLDARLTQARDSNPAGWEALLESQRCIGFAHLGVELCRILARVASGKGPGRGLSDQVSGVVRSLEGFGGTAEDFTASLAGWPAASVDWLRALPRQALEAGMAEEAAALGALLAPLDEGSRWAHMSVAGRAAAELGRPEEARSLLQQLTDADAAASLLQAAQVAAAIGDSERAELLLRDSIVKTQEVADPRSEAAAWSLLYHLLLEDPSRRTDAQAASAAMRAARRVARRPAQPPAAGRTKAGRNEACYCGSGRKYKHCHGSRAVGRA